MSTNIEREAELKRYLEEAFRAFEDGQDERARRLCRQVLAIDPNNTTAHSLMGLLYEREGRMSEAIEQFQPVVEANPQSEADLQTLRRMQGEDEPLPTYATLANEDEEAEARRKVYLWAGVAALAVALLVLISFGVMASSQNRARTAETAITQDLDAARAAYNRGQYTEAIAAAQRVLSVAPGNTLARSIIDQSNQQLNRGRVASPTAIAAAPNVAAAPYSAPALPPAQPPVMAQPAPTAALPAPSRPAAPIAVAPPPARPSIGNPQAPVLADSVPPATVGGGVQVVRPSNQNQFPNLGRTGEAITLNSTLNRSPMYPPRPPVAPQANTPRPPATSTTPRPAPQPSATTPSTPTTTGRGSIHIEVSPGPAAGTAPSTQQPAPAPSGTIAGPVQTTPASPDDELDPAVRAELERQNRIRMQRERNAGN